MNEPTREATQLLRDWRAGNDAALEQLTPLVYGALRDRAGHFLRRERKDHSFQATELVNEVFLRLVDARVTWQDRAHFLAVAAGSMRRILIDHARSRRREKRGGDQPAVRLATEAMLSGPAGPSGPPEEDLLALDEALVELAGQDPRKAKIIELSFFGGLTLREIAEAIDSSKSAVQRDLAFSKAWLYRRLTATDG